MDKAEVRRASEEDIRAFYAKTRPEQESFPTLIAWIGLRNDEPAALFGVSRVNGRWLAFFDITDDARPYKKLIVRTARKVMAEVRRMGIKYVYATIDEAEPLAERFQRSLGFEPDPRMAGLMRWKNDGVADVGHN